MYTCTLMYISTLCPFCLLYISFSNVYAPCGIVSNFVVSLNLFCVIMTNKLLSYLILSYHHWRQSTSCGRRFNVFLGRSSGAVFSHRMTRTSNERGCGGRPATSFGRPLDGVCWVDAFVPSSGQRCLPVLGDL